MEVQSLNPEINSPQSLCGLEERGHSKNRFTKTKAGDKGFFLCNKTIDVVQKLEKKNISTKHDSSTYLFLYILHREWVQYSLSKQKTVELATHAFVFYHLL